MRCWCFDSGACCRPAGSQVAWLLEFLHRFQVYPGGDKTPCESVSMGVPSVRIDTAFPSGGLENVAIDPRGDGFLPSRFYTRWSRFSCRSEREARLEFTWTFRKAHSTY